MERSNTDLTCYVIGNRSLAIKCSELILENKVNILAIITEDEQIEQWAAKNGIPTNRTIPSKGELKQCDYIFSIINEIILPQSFIDLAQRLAINYHDSLLPSYAGVNATAWALLNNENTHGITWHIMDTGIDTGAILKQKAFEITSEDTALTLNLKAYEYAILAFEELLHDLIQNNYQCIQQDLTQRSYYGLHQKPPQNGLIDWSCSAAEIDQLCRALNFGEYPNPFASPKLLIGNELFVIHHYELLQIQSLLQPGKIIEIFDNCVQICTRTTDILVFTLKDQYGCIRNASEVVTDFNLAVDCKISVYDPSILKSFQSLSEDLSIKENFWVGELIKFIPTSLNFIPSYLSAIAIAGTQAYNSYPITDQLEGISAIASSSKENTMASLIIAYLSMINDCKEINATISHPQLGSASPAFVSLIAQRLPFSVQIDHNGSLKQLAQTVEKQIDLLISNKTYLVDTLARHPEIPAHDFMLNIAIEFCPHLETYQPISKAMLVFAIEQNGGKCVLFALSSITHFAEISNYLDKIDSHLQAMQTELLSNKQVPLSKLPLISALEYQQLMHEWNNTSASFDYNTPVYQLIARQAEQTPNRIAVQTDTDSYTYEKINHLANQLAYLLIKKGISEKPLIGVYTDRSPEMLVAILATLKAGGAFVPIDPNYPQSRIHYILDDSKVEIILTQKHLEAQLKGFIKKTSTKNLIIKINLNHADLVENSHSNPKAVTQPSDLAYLVYTSGSTGSPKGVMVEHQNFINFVLGYTQATGMSADDQVLGFSSFSFDAFISEFFTALTVGATYHLVNRNDILPPAPLASTLLKRKITMMQLPPSVLSLLPYQKYPHLKTIMVGGEPCSVELIDQWSQSCQIINVYGVTETTVITSVVGYPSVLDKVTIGYPLLNTQLYILNSSMQPLPIGVAGELYIGGSGVTRGYLNNPQLTADKFISNPFIQTTHAKLYKSGDLCKRLNNGDIEYIGRIDNQIKLRGFRIEPYEIEAALLLHPAVLEALVLAKVDYNGSKFLAAYLRLDYSRAVDIVDIRLFISDFLPQHMIPAAYIALDKFPLTTHGKIDVAALPEPTTVHYVSEQKFIRPSTDEELILANLWGSVLQIDPDCIGIHNNFFELGGHSLLATSITLKISEYFLTNIQIADFFNNPTIAQQVRLLHNIRTAGKSSSLPIIERVSRFNAIPLSLSQRQLWLYQELNPNNSAYNIPSLYKISGGLNVNALSNALLDLVKRHEILRTNFKQVNGELSQVIYSPATFNFNLEIIDVSSFPVNAIYDLIYRKSHKAFKLDSEPLIRSTLFSISNDEHLLFVCFHHIVFDGWSYGCFYQELSELYHAHLYQKPSTLKPLDLQYADFSYWQNYILEEDHLRRQEEYWKAKLVDLPITELPTDFIRPLIQTYNGKHYRFTLSNSLMDKITELAKTTSSSLFTVLLTAYYVLINRYINKDDLVVSTPVANRQHEQVEGMIGFFVNNLVLRSDLTGSPTFLELLERNKSMLLEAYANQDVPFERLVQILNPPFDSSRQPLCQLGFLLNQFNHPQLELDRLNITEVPLKIDTAKCDLSLIINTGTNETNCIIEYCTDIFEEFTMVNFARHFECLLKSIVQTPKKIIHYLKIFYNNEPQKLLEQWNSTDKSYSNTNQLIHLMVEEQAKLTPHAKAVSYLGQSLTYDELNNKANAWAHYLHGKGVAIGELIAICNQPCIDNVIAMLAILKAGATYVPIDPNYPLHRIQYMLDDSGCRFILSSSQLENQLGFFAKRVIPLDNESLIAKCNQSNPQLSLSKDATAYVMYTSGTTGDPKGVLCTHANLFNRLAWMQDELQLSINDSVIQKTSYCFDVSVWEFFWPLVTGAHLVIAPQGSNKDSDALIDLITKHKITVAHFVPSLLKAFLNHPDISLANGIKKIICSGEKLSYQLQLSCFNKLPNTQIYNLYGPTETTIDVTYWHCNQLASRANVVPIGKPIANTKAYILNHDLCLMPIGAIGELYISGKGVTKGYLNKPSLTKSVFLRNPFANDSHGTLYKTGDLVRWLPDGTLEYIDRIDNQVKIRGYRVELSEIESYILKYESVEQCVVVASSNFESLIAYIVPKSFESFSEDSLNRFLTRHLPSYMVPSIYITSHKFPLSVTGKIDRKSLALMARSNRKHFVSYASPQNPAQTVLAEIWSEILEAEQIGINDNFFEIGGHSLAVLKMLTKIHQRFGIKLQIHNLFENPTIAELSQIITELQSENQKDQQSRLALSTANTPLVPLHDDGDKTPIFLFHPIGGTIFCYMHLGQYLNPNHPIYCIEDPSIKAGGIIQYHTIEELVSYYIKEIKSVQPQGPYYLAGFSSGATLAVEACAQLQAAGDSIAMLCSIDGWARYPEELGHQGYFEANMRRLFEDMKANYVEKGISEAEPLLELQWQRAKLNANYQFKTINQKLILLKAKELLPIYSHSNDSYNFWSPYLAKGIDLHIIQGNHDTILQEPYVRSLADIINSYLRYLDANNCTAATQSEELMNEAIIA